MRLSTLFTLLLCCTASSPRAEVVEDLDWRYCTATHRRGDTLLEALNRASPIREDDSVYHGYTRWNVRWNYRWWREPNGRCRITSVTTTASGEITLPELETTEPRIQQRFDTYLENLRTHELGHFAFGQRAAQKIDRGILGLPEHSSCPELEARANALGHEILNAAIAEERAYDKRTGHGRTQGAYLER